MTLRAVLSQTSPIPRFPPTPAMFLPVFPSLTAVARRIESWQINPCMLTVQLPRRDP